MEIHSEVLKQHSYSLDAKHACRDSPRLRVWISQPPVKSVSPGNGNSPGFEGFPNIPIS